MSILLFVILGYFAAAWAFGAFYIWISDVCDNSPNCYKGISLGDLFFISIVTPLVFWLMILFIVGFYIVIGGLNFLEKLDAWRN